MRCGAGTLLAALLVLMAAPAHGQDRKASLSATLTLRDLDGRAIGVAQKDQAFRLQVDLEDIVTKRPPKGIQLRGWIRRVDRLNPSCEDEARAFRVTQSIASGKVDLNGAVVTVLDEDGNFGIVDPKLGGQPATMLGVAALGRMPSDFAIDRASLRALFAFAERGVVEDVSLADGSRRVIAEGLRRPSKLAIGPTGNVWVGQGGNVSLIRDGRAEQTIPVGDKELVLLRADSASGTVDAVSSDGGVARFVGGQAGISFQGQTGGAVADAAFVGEDGVLTLAPHAQSAQLRYFDDFGPAIEIPLGFAARRLAVSPDSRIALAYAPQSPGVAIVDLAAARVVQTVELKDATVAEVAFTERAAFLATSEGAYVAVLDLKSVEAGKAASLRPVPIGGTAIRTSGERRLLAPMLPSPEMLVVDRSQATGWIVPEIAAVGNVPPMGSIRLPGTPLKVDIVDRSFRETHAGRFETVARIKDGGEHELVLTTGIAGMTTCIRLSVDGARDEPPTHLFHLSVNSATGSYRAGTEQELEFAFSDENGRALDVDTARFLVPSLASAWSTEVVARRDAGGKLKATIRFPHAGIYALQPIGTPRGWQLKSAPVIEVSS